MRHHLLQKPPRIRARNTNLVELRRAAGNGHRGGITLFEVVLALGIFTASMAAMSQLLTTGMQAAVRSRLQTQAILRCESKLNEIVAGVEPMQAVSETPFEDDKTWLWGLEIGTGPHPDLLELIVVVSHAGESTGSSVSYSLSRYARDPQIYLDVETDQEE